MSTQLKLRRDTSTDLGAMTPVEAEPGYDQTNKRLIVGDGVRAGGIPHASYVDVQNDRFCFDGSPGGSADAMTLAPTPAPSAYATGQRFKFKAGAANTGAVTVNVSSLGVKSVKKVSEGSKVALEAGDIASGGVYEIVYDGVDFQVAGGIGGGGVSSTGDTITGRLNVRYAGEATFALGSTNAGGAFLVLDGNADGDAAGGDYSYIRHRTDGMLEIYNLLTQPIRFGTAGGERARIDGSGDMHVAATSAVTGSSNGLTFQAIGVIRTSRATTSATNHCLFYNGNGQVGSIRTDGTSTSFNTSSDYRLKEQVADMSDALARLMGLRPVRFAFKADPARHLDGFLAHEVAAVVPEAVSGEKDAVDADGEPVWQGIDLSKLVPLLVAAVQALTARVEALESQQSP